MVLNPADAFGAMAKDYDSIARRGMPVYDEMLEAIMGCTVDGPVDVLELGCGTGALTLRLAEHYPLASLTAIDAAPEMLAIARERLAAGGAAARVELREGLFEDLEPGSGAYDLIATNMALHHIEDKQPFYTALRAALRPGGLLVLGDELQGALPHIEDRFWSGWLDFARRPGGLAEAEIADILSHVDQLDHYETLPRQLELLQRAGFDAVDCIWRKLNYAVCVAQA
jgi:ubiquinone/menaquinone biosynthesis C-methylase UbiE